MLGTPNGYALSLGPLLEKMPKQVIAAVAVAFAERIHGEFGGDSAQMILDEWRVLFQNGIVPQRPPATNRLAKDSTEG